jgi:hypothetical protein
MIKVGLGKVIAAAPVLYTVSLQSYSFFCTQILELQITYIDCLPITTKNKFQKIEKRKRHTKKWYLPFFVRALQYETML